MPFSSGILEYYQKGERIKIQKRFPRSKGRVLPKASCVDSESEGRIVLSSQASPRSRGDLTQHQGRIVKNNEKGPASWVLTVR